MVALNSIFQTLSTEFTFSQLFEEELICFSQYQMTITLPVGTSYNWFRFKSLNLGLITFTSQNTVSPSLWNNFIGETNFCYSTSTGWFALSDRHFTSWLYEQTHVPSTSSSSELVIQTGYSGNLIADTNKIIDYLSLASTSTSFGANLVLISDTASKFSGTTVEQALFQLSTSTSGGGGNGGWTTLYEINFQTAASTTFTANGTVTVDGKPWVIEWFNISSDFGISTDKGLYVGVANLASWFDPFPGYNNGPNLTISFSDLFGRYLYSTEILRISFQFEVDGSLDQLQGGFFGLLNKDHPTIGRPDSHFGFGYYNGSSVWTRNQGYNGFYRSYHFDDTASPLKGVACFVIDKDFQKHYHYTLGTTTSFYADENSYDQHIRYVSYTVDDQWPSGTDYDGHLIFTVAKYSGGLNDWNFRIYKLKIEKKDSLGWRVFRT